MRYLPEFEFPPYSYVPGKTAHPKSHPSGHQCPGPGVTACCADLPSEWESCQLYLWGVDLFNHRFYWESHEAWEEVWIALGRRGACADFTKGLIKLAAAGVKVLEGNPMGMARHARRAAELFELTKAKAPTIYCGCHLDRLIANSKAMHSSAVPNESLPLVIELVNRDDGSVG